MVTCSQCFLSGYIHDRQVKRSIEGSTKIEPHIVLVSGIECVHLRTDEIDVVRLVPALRRYS